MPQPRDHDGTLLVKVLIEYVDNGVERSERVWARPLSGEQFEIRNSPWFAYRLNWGDVVRCVEVSPEEVPRVLEVVKRGGHRTLRIMFNDAIEPTGQEDVIEELNSRQASVERFGPRFLAVDVPPAAGYDDVFAFLAAKTEAEWLIFEEAWRDEEEPGFGPTYRDAQPTPSWLEGD